MKRRWIAYLLVGMLFGIFDFVYLDLLSRVTWPAALANDAMGTPAWFVRFVVLNLGLWLVPVVPIAIREARQSRSRLRSALAGLAVWCAGIVAYYLTYAAELAFWPTSGRPELHISNRGSDTWVQNWRSVLEGTILGGMAEWMLLAIVGGAIVGLLASSAYLRFGSRTGARSST